jgi:two-component system response regulator MprA
MGLNTTILIIEDDEAVRSSLALGLRLEGYTVLEAATGSDGLAHLAHDPALVILDVLLPGLSGFSVLETIRSRSSLPVLMLTALDEVEYKVKGLRGGADDYVVKPYSLSEVLARIEALLRRSRSEPSRLGFEDVTLDASTMEVWRGNRSIELTPKTFRLLQVFLEYPRRVMPRETLMRAVWGEDVDANTLDALVAGLRRTLGEPSLIQTVRGVGYALKRRASTREVP